MAKWLVVAALLALVGCGGEDNANCDRAGDCYSDGPATWLCWWTNEVTHGLAISVDGGYTPCPAIPGATGTMSRPRCDAGAPAVSFQRYDCGGQ